MTTSIGVMPPAMKPWERFAWTPVQQGRIYRDWGVYLSHNDHNKVAEKCYDNCLEINPRDARALYMRSLCKRSAANSKSALEDALAATEIESFNPDISFAVCKALHELNEFESCKAELHENTRKFTSTVVKSFLNHINVVDQNLHDCLGDSLGYFMLRNDRTFKKVIKNLKCADMGKQRHRWKELRDQNACDVLSIPDVKEKLLSPRELARRNRWLKVYAQTYLGRSWIDAAFLSNVIKKGDWLPSTFVIPKPFLSKISEPSYEIVEKLVKMLHARSPLYNEFRTKFKDEKLFKNYKSNYLNFTQYRTRRNMYVVLRTINAYRAKGEIEKMTEYIESIMGDYVVLKTNRIMPWKFEFVNEVYNTLGLAHSDQYVVSDVGRTHRFSKLTLKKLLNINYEATERPTSVEFGKKETKKSYAARSMSIHREAKYQKLVLRLEKRKIFAVYPIERCYLWHEIARTNFKLGRCDVCCTAARRAIEESKNCNSKLWELLSLMLIVKAYASMRKVEYCQKALEESFEVAKSLKEEKIMSFIDFASCLNDEEISLKRKVQSFEFIRKRRSDSISRNSSIYERDASSETKEQQTSYN